MSHSPIGPSAAKRILACPGSVELVAKAPKQESSKYAEEGTLAHEVAEAYVLGNKLPSSATEEMIEGAKMYAGLIEDIMLAANIINLPVQLEAKVRATSIREDAYGTCDAYLIADNVLHVIDYKYGKGVAINVENNDQLLMYAAGILDSNLIEYLFGPNKIEKIHLYIVQPRNGGVSRWSITYEEVANFEHRMRAALKSSDLNITDSCRWCPALAFCPKQLENIKDKFGVQADEPIKALPSIENVHPSRFKVLLDNADLLESWIKAVRSQAFASIGRGMIIDGYELTEGLGNRKWKDEKQLEDMLSKAYHMGDTIYDKKLKSPTQMAKVVAPELIEPYIIRESTGKRLTKTEHKAPDLFTAFNVIA